MAHEACDMVIETMRNSQLNFVLQETPYSAFITIRKSFCKGATNLTRIQNKTAETHPYIEELKNENDQLQNDLKEKESELVSSRKESAILQSRLRNADTEMLKHFDDSKLSNSKLSD